MNSEEIANSVRVWMFNGTVLGAVTMAHTESVLKLVLLLMSIAYTAVQIRKAREK